MKPDGSTVKIKSGFCDGEFSMAGYIRILIPGFVVLLMLPGISQPNATGGALKENLPANIADAFEPPAEYKNDLGGYRSPLLFRDGGIVKTPEDWKRRRAEILKYWHEMLGAWPALLEKPGIEYLTKTKRDNITQHKVRVEIAPDKHSVDGYLLIPQGKGPFPAVLVVFYEAETGAGLNRERLDFGYQLAKRGFAALSIGTPDFCSLEPPYKPLTEAKLQPLSALAYVAANCHTALASLPDVDAERIGIIGHSYGGKWAMFGSCFYEKFACAVWSDPGIVFDETRPNVNYWEPWYLGWEAGRVRERGVPGETKPRTGPYKKLVEQGRDLHEIHTLMAPRPFLVSGGSEDPPQRWQALNHTVAVNKILGYENRVAMTNRKGHSPTDESNSRIYSFFEHFLKPSLAP